MVYMDDLLVYSKDEESHAALLSEVLEILWKHKMYPKFSKCQLGARSIEYLGYNVSAEGVAAALLLEAAGRNASR